MIVLTDNRWSQGQSYQNLGFKLKSNVDPEFKYINGSKANKRFNIKPLINDNKIGKIWDCGHKEWILNV